MVAGRDTLPRDAVSRDSTARDTLELPGADSAAAGDAATAGDSAAVGDSAAAVGDPAAAVDSSAAAAGPALPDSAAADTLDAGPDDPPFPQQDDIFGQLLGEPGYQAIRYQGRGVELDVDRQRVQLNREAQVMYEQSTIDADTITYEAGLQFVRGCGNISLTGEGENVISDECLNYDVSATKGTVVDARTSFAQQGADWFIRGLMTMRGSGTAFVETGNFTSCDLDEPHYYFRAGQIKVVSNDIVVAWPVTLYIQNVPVAWLPFFAQDIREERRSGFLPPRFGFNDVVASSSNARRSITDFGYYFAFNDFMDAQATADWFSGRFTRLNGAVRYRSIKKFFRGNVIASYSFGNEKTLQFQMRHNHELTPVTDIRVNANFISNTTVFERQTFDPTVQTQRIASDVGVQHRFPFASVNVSGSRRQDLGAQKGRTDLTLPKLQMTFSPLTLFRAPRNRSGPFNNIVVNGAFSASRLDRTQEESDGKRTEVASANSAVRIGSFGVSGRTSFNRNSVLPFQPVSGADTTAAAASGSVSKLDYGAQAEYQIDLIGSTTLRPTLSVDASRFQSDDTNGELIAAPARLRIGAAVSTDIYGFFPGVGPFERIRHKVSPRFHYDYSPAVEASDSLLAIPGFPVSNSKEENRLRLTLNQTFEAKLREEVELDPEAEALLEGRSLEADSTGREAAAATPGADSLAAAGDSAEVLAPEVDPAAEDPAAEDPGEAARGLTDAGREAPGAGGDTGDPDAPRRAQPRRNVVLLGINSSPLTFDWSRENESPLTTDRWSHRINSDLLRGLSLNMSLDLFEGTGEERVFAPILSSLTGSFTFSSASGLGGLLGLGGGGGGGGADPQSRLRNAADSRYRLQSFDENPDPGDPGLRAGGPWTLALTYSLQRGREDQSSQDRQSLNAVLSLNPSPNWRLAWRTTYNLTNKEFGEHLITLDRALHRWIATFMFARSPNGNFIFQMSVSLMDAPDLKFDYDQQSQDGQGGFGAGGLGGRRF
ncbi:MAG: putative LPS assembly protein LptD [Gemmatimonadota bacterium]|uniref:LPS-assembly protein LptD n=1 Tax=Candidatus Palauibacter scopulicola TaxID=3056741 RepID=UPI00239AF7AF|nr:putative LPS assembly protein LptD [Candidatus Palauibacter scopulicola]MDE2662306.1 putative LPS assembly protein LptD [Candidatus Palauibacter scopulicola]